MTDKILEAVKALGGDLSNSFEYKGEEDRLCVYDDGEYVAYNGKGGVANYVCTVGEFNNAAAEWLKEAYMHNAAIDLEWDVEPVGEFFPPKWVGIFKDGTISRLWNGHDADVICTIEEFKDYCAANKPQSQVETTEEREAFDVIESKQMSEWNGEGLPPVGCECEIEYPAGSWNHCKYMGKGLDGMNVVSYVGGSTDCLGSAVKFRPIKSPRDKFVERLRKDLVAADYPCNLLYDWLKSLAPEQKKEFGL